MGATPWYASRESVKSALDIANASRTDRQIDDALASATDKIHGDLHRVFYPQLATRYFDWPNYQRAGTQRLYLEQNELISVTTLVAGGQTLATASYWLEPDTGPPYTLIRTNLSASQVFASGVAGYQRAIALTGWFAGSPDDQAPAGTATEVMDATETDLDVSDGSLVGVGDLLVCDSERMVVTGKGVMDTTVNTGGALDALVSAQSIPVVDGTLFHVGEELVVDVERMLITDVVGNTLVVRRAWAGTVLAAHLSGADIYAARRLTVVRGTVGTTAATHLINATLTRWKAPALVRSLCIAEAMVQFELEKGSYATTIGEGETTRQQVGAGLPGLRAQAYTRYGRKARISAI